MAAWRRWLGVIVGTATLSAMLAGCVNQAGSGSDDGSDADAGGSAAARNVPPTARVGDPQTVRPGELVVLSGAASVDADGNRLTFLWQQLDGPPQVDVQDRFSSAPRFVAPAVVSETTLTFRLTVADGFSTSSADAIVTVVP